MTSTTKKKARRPQIGPMERARRQANYIRLLAFLVAVLMLVVGLKLGLYPELYLLGVAGLMVADALCARRFVRNGRGEGARPLFIVIGSLLAGCILLATLLSSENA